jgi:hypothetical protein
MSSTHAGRGGNAAHSCSATMPDANAASATPTQAPARNPPSSAMT